MVLRELGTKLHQLNGVTCCPEPFSTQTLNPSAWYALAARNICLAEERELDILTLCNGCNATLHRVNEDLKTDLELRLRVNEHLKSVGRKFKGKIEVQSILRVMYGILGLNELKAHVTRPLEGIQVAVHYGCHIFDELKTYDDVKKPNSLKYVVRALGASVVSYPSEMLCCGAFARPVDQELSQELVEEKLNDLSNAGADCLVVICPYCYAQYDLGQVALRRRLGKNHGIPVLFLSQLVGLALGFEAREMGLCFSKVRTDRLVQAIE